MNSVTIRALPPGETPPMDLLLLADPSEAMVSRYIHRGRSFVAEIGNTVVGESVLVESRPATIELVNLAVREGHQRRGIGRSLVQHAIAAARDLGCGTIEVGTGNTGMAQLAFYQRCGFRIVGVDLDFFVRHYPEPIHEHGLWCRDMIRLALDLDRPTPWFV